MLKSWLLQSNLMNLLFNWKLKHHHYKSSVMTKLKLKCCCCCSFFCCCWGFTFEVGKAWYLSTGSCSLKVICGCCLLYNLSCLLHLKPMTDICCKVQNTFHHKVGFIQCQFDGIWFHSHKLEALWKFPSNRILELLTSQNYQRKKMRMKRNLSHRMTPLPLAQPGVLSCQLIV